MSDDARPRKQMTNSPATTRQRQAPMHDDTQELIRLLNDVARLRLTHALQRVADSEKDEIKRLGLEYIALTKKLQESS